MSDPTEAITNPSIVDDDKKVETNDLIDLVDFNQPSESVAAGEDE